MKSEELLEATEKRDTYLLEGRTKASSAENIIRKTAKTTSYHLFARGFTRSLPRPTVTVFAGFGVRHLRRCAGLVRKYGRDQPPVDGLQQQLKEKRAKSKGRHLSIENQHIMGSWAVLPFGVNTFFRL